jgi:hypothetical protein
MQTKKQGKKGLSKNANFPRKFYRTVYTLEVLSEEPVPDITSLDDLHYQTQFGEYSGITHRESSEEVNGKTMADLLMKQGSEPGFFKLDEQGNDTDEDWI